MTVPRHVDCHCGHNRMSHEVEDAPACVHDDCGCTQYRPRTGPAVAQGSGSDALIAAGKKSDVRSIASLAEKIEKNLGELRAKLSEDREAAAVRAEVRRLEGQLAAAKAKLRTRSTTAAKSSSKRGAVLGEFPCPDCDKVCTSGPGLSAHKRFNHAEVSS